MDNYPIGAKDDPDAPYNEQEEVFHFEVEIKGKIYVPHNGYLDKDEIRDRYLERIQNYINKLEKEGDMEVTKSFSEIWQ